MARVNSTLDTKFFNNPIPKNSKFMKGDWILKHYGTKGGQLAQVIGYRSGYYAGGDYLIEFEDGYRLKTKQKYFRGPYKTKEIAERFAKNPNLEEKPEDLRLKASAIRTEYKSLPKLEQKLKEIYTKAPYNFKWLDVPITVKTTDYKPEAITILATRKEPDISLNGNVNIALKKEGVNQFYIIRLNDPLTKNLITRNYSPYHISYPLVVKYPKQKWNFKLDPKTQASNLYFIKQSSYNEITKNSLDLEGCFEKFNTFLSKDKLEIKDLIDICGNAKPKDGKKIISFVDFNALGIENNTVIKEYHANFPFTFDDQKALNLDNCPLSAPQIRISGDSLQTLSTNNGTETKKIQICNAPLIKNLKGLETFKGLKEVEIGNRYHSRMESINLESLEGCPQDIKASIFVSSNVKTLKGLPKTLKTLDVYAELDSFDCRQTTIDGRLEVWTRPKSLAGLPKASSYEIRGYTEKEIEQEIQFREVVDRLPELDGVF
jgi:hypothetical protein